MLTLRVILEILHHEGLVTEAYKDSKGVWTWSIGITNASGHQVYPRYLDTPQTIERCLEVYIWLLKTKYYPEVLAAFKGKTLTEAQLAAALSFHWNTGAIGVATWVKSWKLGLPSDAKTQFMRYNKPPEIVGRRRAERDLFFDGKWQGSGYVTLYDVMKPSYHPRWRSARRINVEKTVAKLLAAQND